MKRKISIILSISIIIGIFSGCAIKKEAGATGENTSESSWEETFEITPEITKEPATDENGKNTDGDKDTGKNDKPEVTPEFYDFMNLDPDVDIENEQVREDIRKRISDYRFRNAKCNFTKKENYFIELYYRDMLVKPAKISYYLKHGTTDFHSPNTKKKLDELGFEFSSYDGPEYAKHQTEILDCSDEEYMLRIEKAMKILLEDYNVVYVNAGISPTGDV